MPSFSSKNQNDPITTEGGEALQRNLECSIPGVTGRIFKFRLCDKVVLSYLQFLEFHAKF